MDVLMVIMPLVVGFVCYQMGYRAAKKDAALEYKWACMEPDCKFKVSSDNPEMTLKLSDYHVELMHHA